MRSFLTLFVLVTAAQSQPFGSYFSSYSPYGPILSLPRAPTSYPLPTGAFEPVKEWFDVVPPQLLSMEWPNTGQISPNVTTSSGLMKERPKLWWPSQPGELYTVIMWDPAVVYFPPNKFVMWIVTNIPQHYVERGNEVMEYVTPITIVFSELTENGIWTKDVEGSKHPIVTMVFKQPGRIVMEETQRGCNPEAVDAHLINPKDLIEKYSLEAVAGNFVQNPYSGIYTDEVLCRLTKCTGQPFPGFVIPGVNDLPSCQADTFILDMTVRGPSKDKRKEYGKYVSDFSVEGITPQIKTTAPKYSTGQANDFIAIQGTYNNHLNGQADEDSENTEIVPYGVNNQDDALDGDISLAFWTYPSAHATVELFKNAVELLPSIPKLLSNNVQPGNSGFKVILSRPLDQDFNPQTIPNLLNKPGMIMEVDIVKVKEGKEEEFEELRKKLITRSRSSNNIVNVYTFQVDKEIITEEDPLYFDATNNQVTVSVFTSEAARQQFLKELRTTEHNVFGDFLATFHCIMCATFTDRLPAWYYPPFDH